MIAVARPERLSAIARMAAMPSNPATPDICKSDGRNSDRRSHGRALV